MSTGDVLSILNSDDIYYDNRVIERLVSAFSRTHGDVLYSDAEYFKGENGKYKIVRKWIAGSGNVRLGWIPCHLGIFVKHEVYEKIGKYNTKYSIAADYDFLFRVFTDNEFKISCLNSYIVRMRNGSARKNIDSPFGKSIVIVAENEDGEMVGSRVFWPWKFRIRASELLAYQPTDAVIDPKYQGTSLFYTMIVEAL